MKPYGNWRRIISMTVGDLGTLLAMIAIIPGGTVLALFVDSQYYRYKMWQKYRKNFQHTKK